MARKTARTDEELESIAMMKGIAGALAVAVMAVIDYAREDPSGQSSVPASTVERSFQAVTDKIIDFADKP